MPYNEGSRTPTCRRAHALPTKRVHDGYPATKGPMFEQLPVFADEEDKPMDTDRSDQSIALHEAHAEVTRYIRHHLPWDRFSRRRPGRVGFSQKPFLAAKNPDLDDLAVRVWTILKGL